MDLKEKLSKAPGHSKSLTELGSEKSTGWVLVLASSNGSGKTSYPPPSTSSQQSSIPSLFSMHKIIPQKLDSVPKECLAKKSFIVSF